MIAVLFFDYSNVDLRPTKIKSHQIKNLPFYTLSICQRYILLRYTTKNIHFTTKSNPVARELLNSAL